MQAHEYSLNQTSNSRNITESTQTEKGNMRLLEGGGGGGGGAGGGGGQDALRFVFITIKYIIKIYFIYKM